MYQSVAHTLLTFIHSRLQAPAILCTNQCAEQFSASCHKVTVLRHALQIAHLRKFDHSFFRLHNGNQGHTVFAMLSCRRSPKARPQLGDGGSIIVHRRAVQSWSSSSSAASPFLLPLSKYACFGLLRDAGAHCYAKCGGLRSEASGRPHLLALMQRADSNGLCGQPTAGTSA